MCSLFVRPYVYFYGLISPPDPWYRYRYSGVFCIHLIDRSQQLTFKLSSSWRINLLNLTLSIFSHLHSTIFFFSVLIFFLASLFFFLFLFLYLFFHGLVLVLVTVLFRIVLLALYPCIVCWSFSNVLVTIFLFVLILSLPFFVYYVFF